MPRVGDTGVNVDVITKVNLEAVVGIHFAILRPDMTSTRWYSGSVVDSGEGRVRYTLSENDLGMQGEYVIAPFLDFGEGKQFHTPAIRLPVHSIWQP